ncbi:MAG: glutamate-cysteine ligase family protein, partial [Gemmatimonadetes bacterium]|nr:glutamate-cysteine ligase family protein [Gemmatimonadota bacterium]
DLRRCIPALHAAAREAGIALVGAGIDPFNPIEAVPLQTNSERYRRMQAYFASIGPAGVRMMRQTASIQLSVDATIDPMRTWRVLNAAAPVLVAIFANSNRYAGTISGWASYRARTWQALDPSRTGVHPPDRDDVGAYAEWALDAPLMFMRDADGSYLPLRTWIARGAGSADLVATHLSTLFPEVRPRGHFEVRSVDALPTEWLAAPILLVAGIAFDCEALSSAAELLGGADADALRRAAASGLRDPGLHRTAVDLIDIAMAACERAGRSVAPDDLDSARAFFETFTQRGRHVFDRSARTIPTAA